MNEVVIGADSMIEEGSLHMRICLKERYHAILLYLEKNRMLINDEKNKIEKAVGLLRSLIDFI